MNTTLKYLPLGLALLMVNAFSEPYMAVRSGLKCVVCHVNVTGGGKRTEYGVQYGFYKLNMEQVKPNGLPFFGGRVNKNVSVGANFRMVNGISMKYDPDVPADVPADSASVATFKKSYTKDAKYNPFVFKESNVYFQFDLIPEKFIFYWDQDINSKMREGWSMYRFDKLNGYIKAGFMLLPYGWRIINDESPFIRDGNVTDFSYGKRGTAIEFGIEPGPLSLVVNITDNARWSAMPQVVFPRGRVGLSLARLTKINSGGFLGDNYNYGLFGGVNFGRFTILAEVDAWARKDVELGIDVHDLGLFLENNLHIVDGLSFKTIFEFQDPNTDLLGNEYGISYLRNGRSRLTLGVEAFPIPYLKLVALYAMASDIPESAFNQDQIIFKIHTFF